MLEFYGQDVVGFGTFVTQFSNVVPSIQIWAQELHQKTEQNSGGTILENHDGRSAHKKCKRADCEPSQHEDLDSAYPLPDPTNFEPPNAGGGGGHTHTDTQTDRQTHTRRHTHTDTHRASIHFHCKALLLYTASCLPGPALSGLLLL